MQKVKRIPTDILVVCSVAVVDRGNLLMSADTVVGWAMTNRLELWGVHTAVQYQWE